VEGMDWGRRNLGALRGACSSERRVVVHLFANRLLRLFEICVTIERMKPGGIVCLDMINCQLPRCAYIPIKAAVMCFAAKDAIPKKIWHSGEKTNGPPSYHGFTNSLLGCNPWDSARALGPSTDMAAQEASTHSGLPFHSYNDQESQVPRTRNPPSSSSSSAHKNICGQNPRNNP